jgi:ABC-type multidrug transport system ATPase subunit
VLAFVFSFKGVQALKSLTLSVRQNSIFGFLGPNGAGKTTTIRTWDRGNQHWQ